MRCRVILSVFICVFLLSSSSVSADVPHMINYQGKLTTAEGGCLNDTVQITFTLYSDSLGTSADWTETQNGVVVKEGVFSVLLGSADTIPTAVFDGNIKYLGVQVESDPEMRPLKSMVSVAYAYRAHTADSGPVGSFRRIVQNTTETTTTNDSWTELATLYVGANEITAYISIVSRVFGSAVYDNAPPGGGYSRGQLRITIDGVQQITCSPSWPGACNGGDVCGSGSETFITYFYEPTATQKQNGFTVRIEGIRVNTGDTDYQATAGHIQTDVWGM